MSTNPNNAVGTNGAYGGRTSVNALNDNLAAYSRGILSGWACSPNSGLTVSLGGDGTTRDVAIAEDNAGNKTTVNNISGSPIDVTLSAAPGSNSRIDLIVAYVDNPPQGTDTETDNPGACGIISVSGNAAVSPTAPDDSAIRTAITADGASGTTAYYVVLASINIASGTTDITSGNIQAGANAAVRSSNIDFSTLPGNYSELEINTGYTWIDGKYIYKKTVNLGQCPNKTEKTVAANITNLDKLIRLEGMAYSSTAVFYFGPSQSVFYTDTLELGEGSWGLAYVKSNDEFRISTGTNRTNCVAYATIYYTKNN